MALWDKKKLPSRPLTDVVKAQGQQPPDSFQPIVSETPTMAAGRSEGEGFASTKILAPHAAQEKPAPDNAEGIHPELAETLHAAAVKIQPDAQINTASLDDMNVLLKPHGFQCHRLLGSGGMGSVFVATDLKLQRRVAIKVLLPRLSGNQQFSQMFLKEAETVAKFIHPNIVQVYSIQVIQGIYFIVMEFVEGTTLRDKIKREGVVAEDVTLRMMDLVSQALAETHTRGIIHRDIKPQNILLTPDGIPKVADFGLAVSLQETREGAVAAAGTPTYMAPEQARGETPTPASDIYSLGVVMYMMLSGKVPYKANSVEAVLKEISAGNRIDIDEVAPAINPALRKIVRKAMEPNPADRYLTMKLFNAAIRDAWLSYQKAGLKPMLPRVKRAAWAYLAPPIALVIGLFMGYIVHNPTAEKTSSSFEQAFAPRVQHLKESIGRIMDSTSDTRLQMEAATVLRVLSDAFERKDPVVLVDQISNAEFFLDWKELEPMLMKLNAAGMLKGDALKEAGFLWDAVQKKDRAAFYTHRTKILNALRANGQ